MELIQMKMIYRKQHYYGIEPKNKELKRIIKNKITIEKKRLEQEMNFQSKEEEINKIVLKTPESLTVDWQDIYKSLEIK